MAWTAVGFALHNIYNAIENYFLRIAKFFENEIEGATWHRDLVNRMGHEVPSLRAGHERFLARIDEIAAAL